VRISNIDLNLFKPFVAVYENKNIARAAETLFITASAVGMRIKELERQLGFRLFSAHARGVRATAEADDLYAKVAPAFAVINGAFDGAGVVDGATVGFLRVGIPSNVVTTLLAGAFCAFIKKYPHIRVDILNNERGELCEMLKKRDIDVIINKMPIPNDGDFVVSRLCALPKSFFARVDFLAARGLGREISIAEFQTLPLILPHRMRDDTVKIMELLEPPAENIIGVSSSDEFRFTLTKAGMGLGYCNDCTNTSVDVVRVNIRGVKLPEYYLGVAVHTGETGNLVKTFLRELSKSVAP
jgi:DNA-binding transcriptional LysR family regulator